MFKGEPGENNMFVGTCFLLAFGLYYCYRHPITTQQQQQPNGKTFLYPSRAWLSSRPSYLWNQAKSVYYLSANPGSIINWPKLSAYSPSFLYSTYIPQFNDPFPSSLLSYPKFLSDAYHSHTWSPHEALAKLWAFPESLASLTSQLSTDFSLSEVMPDIFASFPLIDVSDPLVAISPFSPYGPATVYDDDSDLASVFSESLSLALSRTPSSCSLSAMPAELAPERRSLRTDTLSRSVRRPSLLATRMALSNHVIVYTIFSFLRPSYVRDDLSRVSRLWYRIAQDYIDDSFLNLKLQISLFRIESQVLSVPISGPVTLVCCDYACDSDGTTVMQFKPARSSAPLTMIDTGRRDRHVLEFRNESGSSSGTDAKAPDNDKTNVHLRFAPDSGYFMRGGRFSRGSPPDSTDECIAYFQQPDSPSEWCGSGIYRLHTLWMTANLASQCFANLGLDRVGRIRRKHTSLLSLSQPKLLIAPDESSANPPPFSIVPKHRLDHICSVVATRVYKLQSAPCAGTHHYKCGLDWLGWKAIFLAKDLHPSLLLDALANGSFCTGSGGQGQLQAACKSARQFLSIHVPAAQRAIEMARDLEAVHHVSFDINHFENESSLTMGPDMVFKAKTQASLLQLVQEFGIQSVGLPGPITTTSLALSFLQAMSTKMSLFMLSSAERFWTRLVFSNLSSTWIQTLAVKTFSSLELAPLLLSEAHFQDDDNSLLELQYLHGETDVSLLWNQIVDLSDRFQKGPIDDDLLFLWPAAGRAADDGPQCDECGQLHGPS
ncbi:uncharacterized protein BJ171DRAFT_233904 [Polychytrium aggregatum]|uniref:uncharacterized protein n=1 Tax=Polychytrium aggregatum TaxID=110093 RepID=UPI0022FE05FC|nr:uncharacterized protein BJ171DRAFT_233904 [Polychytrium aggregatum]KAI9208066.1 hypothetical protein BJ171DRAFT_233904 [Polychytrium aggregatum]